MQSASFHLIHNVQKLPVGESCRCCTPALALAGDYIIVRSAVRTAADFTPTSPANYQFGMSQVHPIHFARREH